MADTREKLIELLECFSTPVTWNGVKLMDWDIPMPGIVKAMADHLIANGVTVADNNVGGKWIPVTERLPTIEDATEQGAVLAWEVSVKHWDIWAWDCVRDYADRFVGWMPLPEPPKGE